MSYETARALLEAPGGMLPVSKEPSLATMRWATLSSFIQVTPPFDPGVLGFGVNELPACWPTIATWPGVPGDGDGDGDGVGVGLGDGGGLDPPPPHERAPRATTRPRDLTMTDARIGGPLQ